LSNHPYSIHSYANPPHLHSFPTRRSSDLTRSIQPLIKEIGEITTGHVRCKFLESLCRSRCVLELLHVAAQKLVEVFIADDPTEQDRKSTRLNSSHGSISYAVFCLKKKKKQ